MEPSEGWIRRSELLERANRQRETVSIHQLDRWRGRGVFPRPQRLGLGRGNGSDAFYPPGSHEHLAELIRLVEDHPRNLDEVGWRLWVRGYPVQDFVRRFFAKVIDAYEAGLEDFLVRLATWAAGRGTGEEKLVELLGACLRSESTASFAVSDDERNAARLALDDLLRSWFTVQGHPGEIVRPEEFESLLADARRFPSPRELRRLLLGLEDHDLASARDGAAGVHAFIQGSQRAGQAGTIPPMLFVTLLFARHLPNASKVLGDLLIGPVRTPLGEVLRNGLIVGRDMFKKRRGPRGASVVTLG